MINTKHFLLSFFLTNFIGRNLYFSETQYYLIEYLNEVLCTITKYRFTKPTQNLW